MFDIVARLLLAADEADVKIIDTTVKEQLATDFVIQV